MATYRKRKNRWQVEIYKNGVRKSKTFNTKGECRLWADEQEESIEKGHRGEHSLYEAIDRYTEEISPQHKSHRWEKIKLNRFKSEFEDKTLKDLSKDDFATWKVQRMKEVSNGSIRREMAIMSQVLNACVNEWGWLTTNPIQGVKRPQDAPPRRRGMTQEEIDAIVHQLGYFDCRPVTTKSHEIAIAFLLAIETAMRAGEILSLNKSRVDLKKRVAHLPTTKNNDSRDVPLSERAIELLKTVDCEFTVKSATMDTMFRKARKKAGIEDLRFHDSRSEALTRLSKKLDVLELARMVGHRDPRSLMIYYSKPAEDIAKKL